MTQTYSSKPCLSSVSGKKQAFLLINEVFVNKYNLQLARREAFEATELGYPPYQRHSHYRSSTE